MRESDDRQVGGLLRSYHVESIHARIRNENKVGECEGASLYEQCHLFNKVKSMWHVHASPLGIEVALLVRRRPFVTLLIQGTTYLTALGRR